eukprot:scaffold10267_cov270-Chaetoceros_neogracile.AAC.36
MTGLANRSREFKKGIDSEQGRRNRNDTRLQLRKNKREEGLQKRRAMNTAAASDASGSNSNSTANQDLPKKRFTLVDIPTLVTVFQNVSATEDDILNSITGFRKMLSVENSPPVAEVIEANMIAKFVQLLTHSNEKIQFEAAWALTNVASTEFTRTVVEHGALPYLVQLLMSGNADVREQSAWCLGNIAGDATDLRDLVLEAGALDSMVANIQNPANDSLLTNVVWALSNLCRGKPQPALELVAPAIPHLCKIIESGKEDALMDACWALSYLSDGNDARIDAVVSTGITSTLVKLLKSDNATIVTPALRTLGNFVSGNDTHTQAVIDADVMNVVLPLLNHHKKNIRKETCWLLSNIAAGNHGQINSLVSRPEILSAVLKLVHNAEWEVRKEATWVASNIATGGNALHVHCLVELGGITSLCSVIDSADPKILLVILEAIQSILRVGEANGRDYIGFVDECDGLDKIENLQEHENNHVYEKAVFIIETFFGVDEGEDENLVPTIDGDTFAFGLPTKAMEDDAVDAPQQPLQLFNF